MLQLRQVDPPVSAEEKPIILERMTYFCRMLSDFTGGEYTSRTICSLDPEDQARFYTSAVSHLTPVESDAKALLLDPDAMPELYEIVRQGCMRREMEKIAVFLEVPAERLKSLSCKKQEQLLGIYAFEYEASMDSVSQNSLISKMKICAGIDV